MVENMSRMALVSVICIGAVFASMSAELLTNASFEDVRGDKAIGWDVPEHYRVVDGCGRNGMRGIAFENKDDKDFYKYPSERVALEKGKRYEFSAWAKTEGLSGIVRVGIEWYDANGKWMGGTYQNGFGGTRDWTRLQGKTPPIPSDAARVSILLIVTKGALGKAWFDDASVKPLDRPLFGGLYSSAYRNLAADGKVRFHAAVNLNNIPGATAVFTYRDVKGEVKRVPASRMTKDAAMLEVEVGSIAMGTHPVTCEIVASGGERLADGALDFTRVEILPKRRTWIDRKRRAIVDGRPFFPLGIYLPHVKNNANRFDNFLSGPFNCIMPYEEPTEAQLDLCRSMGIEVIYPLNSVWPWHSFRPKGVKTQEDAQTYIERIVNARKNHPAIMAWYCNDEIPLEKFPLLLERQRLLERIDPGHPTWTVLYQFGDVREYYPTFDVIGTDSYPIPGRPISDVAMQTRTADEEVMGLKPIWQVPQAFAWADCHVRGDSRFPTREEMVNMSWQCVANGANGLIYWCYRLLYRKDKFLVDRWADICAAAASVKPYIPVILSDEDPPAVTGANEDMSVRAWRYQGKVYLAVVNNTRRRISREIDVDGEYVDVSVLQGAKTCSLKNRHTVSIALDGIELAFISLDGQEGQYVP